MVKAQSLDSEFVIGIFGFEWNKTSTNNVDQYGNYTSSLNVYAKDGFNLVQAYSAPNIWNPESRTIQKINLVASNNMKILLHFREFYRPSLDGSAGINDYNNDNGMGIGGSNPNSFKPRPNFDNLIYLINEFGLSQNVWGYQISEEASYYHPFNATDNVPSWWPDNNFINVEVPPVNISDAIGYFRGIIPITHKLVVMEAMHGNTIFANTIDGLGIYNPQDYLNQVNLPDVFFEASYRRIQNSDFQKPYSNVFDNNPHYLGKYRSIDYAYEKVNNVHAVIASRPYQSNDTEEEYRTHYHSDINIPNANWLWFQAYNSIIHGVNGIWFWDHNTYILSNQEDADNYSYMKDVNNADRFEEQYFSEYYKKYISKLALELRYLSNAGFLNSDPKSVIYTSTHLLDNNCIVPAMSQFPYYFAGGGLRYSIRTNDLGEVIMIVTNPSNNIIQTELDFSGIGNNIIRNSTGVYALFEDDWDDPGSILYKVDRDSKIDLSNPYSGSMRMTYHPFDDNKKLSIKFGPLDVHILKFHLGEDYLVGEDPWNKIWTNNGDGTISGCTIGSSDKLLIGDFDGDGAEEILVAQQDPFNWLTLIKFENGEWRWKWSNYGNAHPLSDYRHNLLVGDFNGDGKDELLCNNTPNGLIAIFEYNNTDWVETWRDNDKKLIPYRTNFIVGDFDGDQKDELLGNDLPLGWMTMFHFDGTDWLWGWSTYSNQVAIMNYRNNLKAGDFNGDGIDDILGMDTWATIFEFNNNNWNWSWSNYGSNSFGGAQFPFTHEKLLVGNIDNDIKEEFMVIQRSINGGWASTFDYNNGGVVSNWSNYGGTITGTLPYINDWNVSANFYGSLTDYYFIKTDPAPNAPNCLLALRNYSCDNSGIIDKYLASLYQQNGQNNMRISHIENNDKIGDEIIQITPNPAKKFINFHCASNCIIESLKIFNSFGLLVKDYEQINISNFRAEISNLPNGVYIYIIKLDNSIKTGKVIKI